MLGCAEVHVVWEVGVGECAGQSRQAGGLGLKLVGHRLSFSGFQAFRWGPRAANVNVVEKWTSKWKSTKEVDKGIDRGSGKLGAGSRTHPKFGPKSMTSSSEFGRPSRGPQEPSASVSRSHHTIKNLSFERRSRRPTTPNHLHPQSLGRSDGARGNGTKATKAKGRNLISTTFLIRTSRRKIMDILLDPFQKPRGQGSQP